MYLAAHYCENQYQLEWKAAVYLFIIMMGRERSPVGDSLKLDTNIIYQRMMEILAFLVSVQKIHATLFHVYTYFSGC